MACYYCRHFKENMTDPGPWSDKVSIVTGVERRTGQCTLSPIWQEVTGLHFCSHFSGNAGLVGNFFRSMHENRALLEDERKRRIAAEKKLKSKTKDAT